MNAEQRSAKDYPALQSAPRSGKRNWKEVRQQMVAEAIRTIRIAQGLSRNALGARLKITERTVQRWEQGEVLPGPHTRHALQGMARVLGHERTAFVLRLPDQAWAAIIDMTAAEWATAVEIRKRSGR